MTLPVRVAALLDKLGHPDYHPCEGAKFHSPRPLSTNGYKLPDKRIVYLCGTCRGNLNVYLFLHSKNHGNLDWPVKREFGNDIRAIGDQLVGRK